MMRGAERSSPTHAYTNRTYESCTLRIRYRDEGTDQKEATMMGGNKTLRFHAATQGKSRLRSSPPARIRAGPGR
jgi:hypothetical protein